MARKAARFVCQQCGASHAKWGGRCDSCGGWNTLVEEAPVEATPRGLGSKRGRKIDFVGLDGDGEGAPRRATGIKEFDRVCGGGLVAGSALLVGGDPGIGKSTLLLQVAAALSGGLAVAYVSGEEAVEQMRMRARRLGLAQAGARLATGTSVRDIAASVDVADGPGAVVIDSIQTMYVDTIDAAPGTVTQVRASAQELIRLAKRRGFILFLVGHVTKEGLIAGPRVLEHMVDTVLYFEGERGHQYRILRAVKNRYGATDEIGVFEMSDAGLIEVSNPSALFLADRRGDVSGACVFPGMEGSRPVLVEIQSLIAPSALATPRRAVVGWDSGRLAMITAVLEARCGLSLASREVYLNVAGGPSRRPIWRWPRRWPRRRAARRWPSTRWSSARSACRERCAPWRTPMRASRKRPSSDSPAPSCPRDGARREPAPPRAGGRAAWRSSRSTTCATCSPFSRRSPKGAPQVDKVDKAAAMAPGDGSRHAMDNLPVNVADIGVGVVLLVSALLAYARGFVHEVLAVGGWIGAIFATFYAFPYAKPLAREYIPMALVADIAAGAVIFVGTLVVLSMLTRAIAKRVKASALNALDRALGFLFGVLRGAVLVCLAYLVLDWMVPREDHPEWVQTAKTLAYVQTGAALLETLVPEEAARKGARAATETEEKARKMLEAQKVFREMLAPETKGAPSGDPPGYGRGERKDMDRLIESNR